MAAITAREFLRQNGFTVGDRGRFNAEQLQFLKDKGFDVTVPVKSDNAKPVVESEGSKIRQWARENGIEVNERGKLSTALKTAYAANDPELASKPVDDKPKTRRKAKQTDESKPVMSGWVAKPTISKPKVRDTNEAYAIGPDGLVIGFGSCGHCKETISRCDCELPKPTAFIVKIMPDYVVSLERPEKLRHERLTSASA